MRVNTALSFSLTKSGTSMFSEIITGDRFVLSICITSVSVLAPPSPSCTVNAIVTVSEVPPGVIETESYAL